ncbi:MAG TPA: M20 family metallopeptidase [Acidimicrobiales bacterium]
MRADVDTGELVALTQALVAVDTRNPPGNERAVAGVCRQALAPYGATVTEVEPADGRLSLLASVAHPDGAAARPTLIVNGHLDVVPVQADFWSRPPFDPVVSEGRLYGRGSADMKGGIAAAICALGALARSGRVAGCDVVFHLVADEERGGTLGTRVLAERGLIRGDACLVPEPTSLSVCIAERGLLVADVIIRGRPGHGSRPREGVSAIEHAASVVLALHAADFGDQPHHLLGTPTANVGEIRGGSGHNTVAESCEVVVDRRLLPGASEEDAVAGLRRRIEASGVNGLDYDLEVRVYGEASELDAAHPFVGQVRRAVGMATGEEPPVIGMSFTTDARFVRNQAGIPAVVCGPGDVELAHGNDEWVSVDRLVAATAAYAELYASYGAEG